MINKMPKVDTRKYLAQEELDEYDSLVLGGVFGSQTASGMRRINALEMIAIGAFIRTWESNGLVTTRRDRIANWLANQALRIATPEYQFLIWAIYKEGLTKAGLEEEK